MLRAVQGLQSSFVGLHACLALHAPWLVYWRARKPVQDPARVQTMLVSLSQSSVHLPKIQLFKLSVLGLTVIGLGRCCLPSAIHTICAVPAQVNSCMYVIGCIKAWTCLPLACPCPWHEWIPSMSSPLTEKAAAVTGHPATVSHAGGCGGHPA